MKKNIIFIYFLVPFILSATEIKVNINWENSNYEIIKDTTIIENIPFSIFGAYQIVGDNIFFIDFSKTNKKDYGCLCFYNIEKQTMEYTNIYSGIPYYVSDELKYVLISKPYISSIQKDIDDIFNINTSLYEEYLLNIELYDLVEEKKLNKYNFKRVHNQEYLKYITLDMYSDNSDKIYFTYGVMDSDKELFKGYVDLHNFNFIELTEIK